MARAILFGLSVLATAALASGAESPNVVFILADDLGWSDVTLYGNTSLYETPHIERLAARGMTFTRAYSASPLCSPTRASILTGLSPARHGITSPGCHQPKVVLEPSAKTTGTAEQKAVPVTSVTRLKTDYPTLPKSLKAAGYATGHFGKWHLGHEPYSPLEHGFDVDVPHHPGPGPAGSYVAPWKFKDFDHDPDVPDQHIEDRMAQEAVAWIEQQEKPFFLNYWMFSVHAPFDAKPSLIEKYRARVDPDSAQRSPTYAAMIESMDDAVGTLLDALDRLQIAERTIVIFASDNGGNMYSDVDGTVPTSNAPLRGGKATMYEEGVRGPCVVVWPGVVDAGSRSDEIIQSCDFYPTLLEVLDVEPQPSQQFDGISIVPALRGGTQQRDAIFTYFPHAPRVPDWLPPAVSVHQGDWKLIRLFHGGDEGKHAWKLFDLSRDMGEQEDLSNRERERVARMDALIDEFLAETHAVLPARNVNFDPQQFDPNAIGQSRRKPARAKAEPRRTPRGPAVAGWKPIADCRLSLKEGSLIVDCQGPDPHLTYQLPADMPAGDYQLDLTMSSTAAGRGQIFWQESGVRPAFFRDRSVVFKLVHDGRTQELSIPFTAHRPVQSLRLDPGQAAGTVCVTAMRLLDDAGNVVYEWRFTDR